MKFSSTVEKETYSTFYFRVECVNSNLHNRISLQSLETVICVQNIEHLYMMCPSKRKVTFLCQGEEHYVYNMQTLFPFKETGIFYSHRIVIVNIQGCHLSMIQFLFSLLSENDVYMHWKCACAHNV